jgi:hypothetical protein
MGTVAVKHRSLAQLDPAFLGKFLGGGGSHTTAFLSGF